MVGVRQEQADQPQGGFEQPLPGVRAAGGNLVKVVGQQRKGLFAQLRKDVGLVGEMLVDRSVGVSDLLGDLLWSRYSLALGFVGHERREITFVVCKAQPGVGVKQLAERIHQRTGLKALNAKEFGWATIWYYIQNTGIPINFGITVIVALIVGTIVSGQTFYIFTLENLRQFGALKAIGATNGRIVAMFVLQAAVVGFAGYSIGEGIVAFFFAMVQKSEGLRGIVLLWQVMAITAVMVTGIILASSCLAFAS